MRRIIGFLSLFAALAASAQAPRLVRDIDPAPATSNESSNPQATGIELFRTDGTEAARRVPCAAEQELIASI